MNNIGVVVCIGDERGRYAALSNYAAFPLHIDGEVWRSVEHYYQAQKFSSPVFGRAIAEASSPSEAKRLAWSRGFHEAVRGDWDEVRIEIMKRALTEKFRQHPLAEMTLKGTWPLPLVEISPEDEFWGKTRSGVGLNRLGELMMEIRERLTGAPNPAQLIDGEAIQECGGTSSLSLGAMTWRNGSLYEEGTSLAYPGFIEIDLRKVNHGYAASHRGSADTEELGRILDRKYAGYSWFQDARSVVPNWVERFLGLLSLRIPLSLASRKVLVVGGGSANEAAMIWSKLGDSVTLTEVGQELVRNCIEGAPEARVSRCVAEDLAEIGDEKVDIYCALRVYDSAAIDVTKALGEAYRVLTAGGLAVFTISNGYLLANGGLMHGQIGDSGKVERARPWRLLGKLITALLAAGFHDVRPFDLDSEVGVFCYRR